MLEVDSHEHATNEQSIVLALYVSGLGFSPVIHRTFVVHIRGAMEDLKANMYISTGLSVGVRSKRGAKSNAVA